MSLQMLFAIASIASYFGVSAFVTNGPTLAARQAIHAIGKAEIVCGVVSQIRRSLKNRLKPTFIILGKPDRDYAFEIAIAKNDLARFNPGPDTWNGKQICVHGRIRLYDKHPIIIAVSPDQISSRR